MRNPLVVSKQDHIDPQGHYEVWHDEPIRAAYDRLFGAALAEYNERQLRPERQISSYYNHVCADSKKHPVYEMIVGVYGKSPEGFSFCSPQLGKEILHQFVDTWQQRNPNLELIGAYYHADEQGEPHIHLDYIPVAHGYKNGLETQTGLVRALGEMGFVKDGKATAQIQWEQRENKYLDLLCQQRGLSVDHPCVKGREHLHTAQYKAEQSFLRALSASTSLEKQRGVAEIHLNSLKASRADLEAQIESLKSELDELERTKAGLLDHIESRLAGSVQIPAKLLRELIAVRDKAQQLSEPLQKLIDRQCQVDRTISRARRRDLEM